MKLLVTSTGNKVPLLTTIKNELEYINEKIDLVASDLNDSVLSNKVGFNFIKTNNLSYENLKTIVSFCEKTM